MLQEYDYRPAPFWFLNHKLEKEELKRQVKLMHEQGIHAFFMHPRAGLKTPYGSNEWFEMIGCIIEEAERLGMQAWLYDEDPFPSGPAGGRVFLDHPEFIARGLVFHEAEPDRNGHVSADLGEGRLLEALAVRTDDNGNVLESRDVFDDVGMIRSDFFQTLWQSPYYVHLFGKTTYPHYRAETFYPHLQIELDLPEGWKIYAVTAQVHEGSKYRYISDNLNPECVRYFIELTHEKYKRHFGGKFGSVIPGIFTDETATGAWFAWTERFSGEFKKRRQHAIDNSYHCIFKGNSAYARKIREAYWRTVQELFIESFFQPVNDWCKANGLKLCGHGIGEEDPLAATNGMNIFALQKYVGIPGFDHITPNIPDGHAFKSLNLGGKLVSSAAEQNGEHRVQSECFGCNPYNFGFDGMKKNMHWLYALGVNWLVPHGFHYSYDGFRKDDAGKSFFFQSPNYTHFHEFAAYAARLGFKLGESRSLTSLCVLFPESVFRSLFQAEYDLAMELREKLYECTQFLIDHHIQFEFTDEATLAKAEVQDGKFTCGKRTYGTLLLPFEFDSDTVRSLQSRHIPVLHFPQDMESLKERDGYSLKSMDGKADAARLMAQYRRNENGRLLYIFNNQDQHGTFRLNLETPPQGGIYLYDAETDSYSRCGDGIFALAPFDAVILELRDKPLECPEYLLPQTRKQQDFDYMKHPQWDYIPDLPGIVAALRDWEIKFNEKGLGKHRYTLLRELTGTDLHNPKMMHPRPIFDRAPETPSIYPAKTSFTARFELEKTDCILVAESETFAGNAKIELNGREIPPFRRRRIYDPWNIVSDVSGLCRKGANELKITWEEAGEFDGLTSIVYLMDASRKLEK